LDDNFIIDFHTHLPWKPRDPIEASKNLVEAMDKAGVTLAVVINVEFSVRTFLENVDQRRIIEAASEALDFLIAIKIPYLYKLVIEPEWAIEEHVRFMRENHRDNLEFTSIAKANSRLIPVASFNSDMSVYENLEKLKVLSDLILGVKLFPTLHFIRPDSDKLKPVYDYIASINGVVIVHTGCDPGIWELPPLCSNAKPSYVARAARENKDVRFIVAHLGAYSALNPGIFFKEALEALLIDNIYADTSAVDPYFIKRTVEEVGYDKILFGSDYPMVQGLNIASALNDIITLDIPGKAKRAMITDNPLKLLKTWSGWDRVERSLQPESLTPSRA